MEDIRDNTIKKYHKLRRRLDMVVYFLSLTLGYLIGNYLDLLGDKFLSLNTLKFMVLVVVIALILGKITEAVADKWYKKNSNNTQ
ncbi:MAG: hypothetical protein WBI89_00725 [Caldicoprobacterales bacterium]|jgi:uncharacterized membrane protein YwzB